MVDLNADEHIEEKKQMKQPPQLRKNAPIPNSQFPIPNSAFTRHKLPLVIFLILSLNVIFAPIVYAATDGTWQRTQAYALGILGFITLGLIIYLFDVVFRPERY